MIVILKEYKGEPFLVYGYENAGLRNILIEAWCHKVLLVEDSEMINAKIRKMKTVRMKGVKSLDLVKKYQFFKLKNVYLYVNIFGDLKGPFVQDLSY